MMRSDWWVGGGLVVVGLMVIGALSSEQTGTTQSELPPGAAAAARRLADSTRADSLVRSAGALTGADARLADNLIHVNGFALAHDSVHHQAVTSLLDTAAVLLKTGRDAEPNPRYAASMLDLIREPITAKQQERLASLRKTSDRQNSALDEEERKAAVAARADARRLYARELEHRLLDEGMNVTVTTSGRHATTLRVEYILVSKVWAHKLGNDGKTIPTIRNMGFEKFILTDGYDETYTWTF